MAALSFDAGVLIALERRDTRAWAWMRRATGRGIAPIVSAVAVAEVWRDSPQIWLLKALGGCELVEVSGEHARAAGVACGATSAATVNAIVAATAATRGATLLTADLRDMHVLAGHFRSLRVVAL